MIYSLNSMLLRLSLFSKGYQVGIWIEDREFLAPGLLLEMCTGVAISNLLGSKKSFFKAERC